MDENTAAVALALISLFTTIFAAVKTFLVNRGNKKKAVALGEKVVKLTTKVEGLTSDLEKEKEIVEDLKVTVEKEKKSNVKFQKEITFLKAELDRVKKDLKVWQERAFNSASGQADNGVF